MEQITEQEPMVRRAMTVEEVFMKNEEERHFYELREKGARDYVNAMITSERRGVQKVALSMLAKNTPIEFIQEVTGLSEEEIKSLHL